MAFDKQIGGMTVYCEASGQSDKAKLGVAWVLVNRLHVPQRFGATIAEVCLLREQFSEWNADVVNNRNLRRAATVGEGDPELASCVNALVDAMTSARPDPTGGATHYYTDDIAAPSWTAKPALRTLVEGRFRFYRNVP